MRMATWNINSVRARTDRVLAFLERTGTDVLALQETKCTPMQFPAAAFAELGYEVVAAGLSQWNGVAILSRVGLSDVAVGFDGAPEFGDPAVVEARAIGATCGGLRVWSLYVPNGRELDHPHYAYKLAWLAALRTQAEAWLDPDKGGDPTTPIALVGDWNVAPLDSDVWDIDFFAGKTHVTPPERAAFAAFADAGYREVTREHVPADGTYTYWDYQQLRFPKNEGMRIDFAWGSPALAAAVTGVTIERNERKGKGASDHVPVIIDLDLPAAGPVGPGRG